MKKFFPFHDYKSIWSSGDESGWSLRWSLHLLDHNLEFTCRGEDKITSNSRKYCFFLTGSGISDWILLNLMRMLVCAHRLMSVLSLSMSHLVCGVKYKHGKSKFWDGCWCCGQKQLLLAGMMVTSAVTMLFTPRLNRAPLTRPQVKARYCRTTQATLVPHTSNTKRPDQTPPPCTAAYLRRLIQILFPRWQLAQ